MHKPGLGARKCGHCGARIEGPQSHLTQQCPRCRSPLYGRTVVAPPAAGGAPKSGIGGMVALAAIATLALLGIAGAVGYVAVSKKSTAAASARGQAAGPVVTPELADPRAATPAASASVVKRVASAAPTSTRPPAPTGSTTALGLVPKTPPSPPSAAASSAPIGSPAPSATASAALAAQKCSRGVAVKTFRPSSPTCSFNEKVSGGPSTIEFPCAGGSATATFGTHTFRGSVTTSSIILSHTEPFTFGGCRVESAQRISAGRNASSGLYTYSERIISGACSGVKTCTATAIVELR